MNLLSPSLENAAIRSILSKARVAAYLLPRLTVDHFGNVPTKQAFRRIKILAAKHGELPSWEDILEDPVLPEDTRDYLKGEKIRIVEDKSNTKRLHEKLEEYRKIRTLFYTSKFIAEEIRKDSINIDSLSSDVAERIAQSRMGSSITEGSLSIGSKASNFRIVENTLLGKTVDFIPTGVKAFDSKNLGIPRGGVFLIAAPSGGGKSVMALNIAMNRALMGVKVCLVSLEMDVEELVMRMLARLSRTNMAKIIRAKSLTKDERVSLLKTYKEFNSRVRRNGGELKIVSPEDDLTLEDILLSLQPYKYDDITVDYMGLCAGMDGDDQWKKLIAGTRFSKRYAKRTKSTVTLLAQLSEEGALRYSRGLKDNVTNFWNWLYNEEVKASKLITVRQGKARQQRAYDFMLKEEFEYMNYAEVNEEEIRNSAKAKSKDKGVEVKGKRRRENNAEFSQKYEM